MNFLLYASQAMTQLGYTNMSFSHFNKSYFLLQSSAIQFNFMLLDLVDDQDVKNQISEIKQEVKVSVERFKRDNTDVRRRSSTNIRR